MKKHLFILTALFTALSMISYAQETTPAKIHQVGINFSTLNQFGMHYKTGSEKTLFRISLLALNLGSDSNWGRNTDSIDQKQQSAGAGFRLGFERSVQIVKQFHFIWGLEGGCNFNYSHLKVEAPYSDHEITSWWVTPLVNLVLGVTYTVADHLVLGAEITPSVNYSYGKSKTTYPSYDTEMTNTGFNFGFTNNYASLSFAYRF